MAVVLKIKFGEDTRRLTLEKVPNFQELSGLLKQIFSVLNERVFSVKYLDDDQDLVTITSDLELKEAISVALKQNSQLPVLRLFIFEKEGTSAPNVGGKQEEKEPQQNASNPFASSPLAQVLGQFLQNPQIGQLLQNPQIGQLLQNPQIQNIWEQLQKGGNGNNASMAELGNLFQNLGLGSGVAQQQSSQSQSQTQTGQSQQSPALPPFLQQILSTNPQLIPQLLSSPLVQQFLPQLLSGFAGSNSGGIHPLFQQFQQSSNSGSVNNNASKEEEEEGKGAVHEGVVCDSCGNTITGIRYKCSSCPDYDLCDVCEKKPGVHDPSHVFLKITKPQNVGRGCPYFRPPWYRTSGHPQHSAPRNLSRFVSDVTIEDGIVLPAEQQFTKIWKLRNEGTTAWPEGTRLAFVGGDKLANLESIAVTAIGPGAEIDVAVDMATPSKAGRYVSYWRLVQPDGLRFGQRLWTDIIVVPPEKEQTKETQPDANQIPSAPVEQPNKMEVETPSVPTPVSPPIYVPPVASVSPVPPVSVPMPVPPVEQPKLSPQMQQLQDMGFSDTQRNAALLAKYDNNLILVLQELLSTQ